MLRKTLAILAVVFVVIQLIPVDRESPADDGLVDAPTPVLAVLERACYDCHSNRTEWPWYSHVAPVSWLVADDVEEGREDLNFTRWNRYDAPARLHLLAEIVEHVEEGEMPLPIYLTMHGDAKLSPADLATLREWAVAAGATLGEHGGHGDDDDEDEHGEHE